MPQWHAPDRSYPLLRRRSGVGLRHGGAGQQGNHNRGPRRRVCFRMDSGCLFFFESGGRRRYGTFRNPDRRGRRPPRDPARRAQQHGEYGRVGLGTLSAPLARAPPSRSSGKPVPHTTGNNATINAVTDLVDCIENDRESISSGRQGRAALEMIMAVYEIAAAGVGARRLPAGDPGQSVRRYAGQRSDIARESPCARR